MQYRRFGRAGLQMPVITCGAMRFQQQWTDVPVDQIKPESQANVEAAVRHALELGMNHIETARGYGTSERQLGQILPKLPRDKMIVQTKVGPKDDPEDFVRDFEDSLARLRLDHVDLFALHGLNDRESLNRGLKCLPAARKLQKQGKVRWVGFSSHGYGQVLLDAVNHAADGGFDYVNMHWFYFYQRNWAAIEAATKRDMGVFVISPNDKGGKLYAPPAKLVELCRPLEPMRFNALFCLSRPQVHTLSVGPSKASDLDIHARSAADAEQAEKLTAPIVKRLEAAYAAAIEPELRNPFGLDLPDWSRTPGHINLQLILWLRNLAVAFDMVDYGQMRYNLLGNGGHWFPGQTAEKLAEIDLTPALRSCPQRQQVLAAIRQAHEMLKGDPRKRLSTD